MVSAIRQKPLLPVLKEKKRYVVYELYADTSLPVNAGNQFISQLQRVLGVFGAARAGLLPVSYDARNNKGIFRVANAAWDEVRAAMLLMTHLREQRVMARPLLVSGILKKVKQQVIVR